jgi:amino acid transporter
MVGAGIFALLGEAGAIAGSAVWISFLLAGGIALLSGYSIGRLGARYPGAGGVVEYLVQGFGVGRFSGAMSIMMYIGALIAVSLVARTFGTYAYALLPAGFPHWLGSVFSIAIVALFMLVNLNGARSMARLERLVVFIKMAVLLVFIAIGLAFMDPGRLSFQSYPAASSILYSLAVTFFAYEGFRIIANAAEDMVDPARTLPRAILTAIAIVMVVYIGIAISVFGNLPADRVIAAKDFALAEAARPVLGETGFSIVAIAALFATASAINASLYAVTNVTYRLAMLGELPAAFAETIGHSREGLVVSSIIIAILATFFDLGSIAAIGAISMLFIHMTVHIGHIRLLDETGASPFVVYMAVAANACAILLSCFHLIMSAPLILVWIGLFVAAAVLIEFILHRLSSRRVKARVP